MSRSRDLRGFLLEHAREPALASRAAARFGISRQAVHFHLARLLREGLLEASGRTRARIYRLPSLAEERLEVALAPSTDEEAVWRDRVLPALGGTDANVLEIARFGLTECLRNAADHSGSPGATVRVRRSAVAVEVSVVDRGEGVFRRLDAADPLHAALDLVKGGRTTSPDSRTGRGLGAVARAVDSFSVWSGRHLLRRQGRPGWTLAELEARVTGTTVAFGISTSSRRTLADSLASSPVVVPVRLALRGEDSPTSRSCARRLLERLETAESIVLDFSGIRAVGPAFANEVSRVFPRENPGVSIRRIGTTAAVERSLGP